MLCEYRSMPRDRTATLSFWFLVLSSAVCLVGAVVRADWLSNDTTSDDPSFSPGVFDVGMLLAFFLLLAASALDFASIVPPLRRNS